MRAAVLRGGEFVVEEIAEPVPAAGQALVRTLANGICGSDLHTVEMIRAGGGRPTDPNSPPSVMGHEFCAEIVDYGPSTQASLPIGTRVCANPFVPGGGLVNPGGLAEMMVLDATGLLPVPDAIPPEHAALTEPLAVGVRAAAIAAHRPTTGPSIVVGCGPIGLAVITALRAAGRGPIIAADLSPSRLEVAEKLGVDVVVDAGADQPYSHLADFDFVEAALSPLLPEGRDEHLGPVIFECVGVPGLIQQIVTGAPRHSHIVVVGVCMGQDTFFPAFANMKELTLSFALAYRPEEFALSHRRIVQGDVDVRPLISSTVGLDETAWAFDALARAEEVKVIVQPNR